MVFYSVENRRIYISVDNVNWDDFCEEIEIKSVKVLANKSRVLLIEIHRENETIPIELPREDFDAKTLPRYLRAVGFDCSENREDLEILLEILHDMEKDAPEVLTFNTLGWYYMDEQRYYAAHRLIGCPAKSEYAEITSMGSQVGTFEEWRQGLIPILHDRPQLQLALAISASAPLLEELKISGLLEESPTYALIGETSSGKTTSLQLAAGVWSNPTNIIESGACTTAYLLARLNGRNAYPFFLDEMTASNLDFSGLLYSLASGQERGLADNRGTARPRRRWLTTFIVSSEKSLYESSGRTDGLHARLLELNLRWTKDAQSAEAVKEFATSAYGTAYVPLVEYIAGLQQGEIVQRFKHKLSEFGAAASSSTALAMRAAKLYVLPLLSAEIASEAWGIEFDMNSLTKMMLNQYTLNSALNNPDEQIYNQIQEFVFSNLSRFPRESGATVSSVWGVRGFNSNKPCVWIFKSRFDRILKEINADAFSTKSRLHKSGYLEKFSDRYYRSINIGKSRLPCVCLYMRVEEVGEVVSQSFKHSLLSSAGD